MTKTNMIKTTNPDLVAFLKTRGHTASIQKDTDQIYLLFKIQDQEIPLFIRQNRESQILNLVCFSPCLMSPKAPPEMGRLLHLLNKEIDLPGFGMDEAPNLVFYRVPLFTYKDEIDEELFYTILTSMPKVIEMFQPVIAAVATGTKFEVIADVVRKQMQSMTPEK